MNIHKLMHISDANTHISANKTELFLTVKLYHFILLRDKVILLNNFCFKITESRRFETFISTFTEML